MTDTTLCFIDTETTGLDARVHQAYEVSWWREDEDHPVTHDLPHTLEHADEQALRVGGYFDRHQGPWGGSSSDRDQQRRVAQALQGVTLVGANPAFDAAMLTRFIGTPVWHYRLINISDAGMWVFGWDRPRSLGDTATECRDRGYDVPVPDHTAEGDVRTTRATYEALRDLRWSA